MSVLEEISGFQFGKRFREGNDSFEESRMSCLGGTLASWDSSSELEDSLCAAAILPPYAWIT